ncbi:competence protein ComK [Aeribacillus composti]|uniref:competence protein ComK n=1 Tax=Aeribacillus pallidus TaxID=33936 RepID=UPI002E9CFE6C|nr:competence protein ComK [Aeribacillus composti]
MLKLFEEACLNNGSTYEGRRQAVIHFTNYTQRIPILINQFEKIIAFPTHSILLRTNSVHMDLFVNFGNLTNLTKHSRLLILKTINS